MILSKKKLSKHLKSLFGFLIAALIIALMLSVTVSAETSSGGTDRTMPDMSDMMPSGTNIPDSNIGGAVEGTSPLESIIPESPMMTLPDKDNGTVPSSDIIGGSGTSPLTDNPETNDTLSRVLGIVITVIVVLAVILLIVALVPKRAYDSRNRKD